MAGRAVADDLLVPLERETDELAPRKRARRHGPIAVEPALPQHLDFPPTDRPTAAEREAAQHVIARMRAADVTPRILKGNASADAKVVACALAMHFGQQLGTDQDAKDTFGVARPTDVRARWVKGKLAQLLEVEPDALSEAATIFAVPTQPPAATPTAAAAPAPAAAAAPAAADDAEAEAVDSEEVGEEVGEEASEASAARPSLDYEESLDVYIEVLREAAAKYRRVSHLVLWSRAQRERWLTLPNPHVNSGDLCPQPNMRVIERDALAAKHLPHALGVIDVLMRQRDTAQAELRLTRLRLDLAQKQTAEAEAMHIANITRWQALLCDSDESDAESVQQPAASDAQLARAEWLKLAALGLPCGPRPDDGSDGGP